MSEFYISCVILRAGSLLSEPQLIPLESGNHSHQFLDL